MYTITVGGGRGRIKANSSHTEYRLFDGWLRRISSSFATTEASTKGRGEGVEGVENDGLHKEGDGESRV